MAMENNMAKDMERLILEDGMLDYDGAREVHLTS
jgi:hypothetical protein